METVLRQSPQNPDVTVLSIEGDVGNDCPDIARLDPLLQRIPSTEATYLVVDLSRMVAVGWAAVAKLLWAAVAIRDAGGDLALAAVPQHILDYLCSLRIDGMIDSYETVNAAVAAVRG